MSEPIWYQDLASFVKVENLPKFIPQSSDSLETKLNTTLRFIIYFALLMLLFDGSATWAVSIVVLWMLISTLIYEQERSRNKSTSEQIDNLDVDVDPVTKRVCKKPSRSNPFMNVLMGEYKAFPNRPPACDISNPSTSELANKFYEHNLYTDADDIFKTNTRMNQRQFYTNPATSIPNDQGSFASWLYAPAPPGRSVCRDGDGDACAARLFHHYPSV